MSQIILTDQEHDLILARRDRAAQAEAAQIEADTLPDVLSLSRAEMQALSPEMRTKLLRHNLQIAMGEQQ